METDDYITDVAKKIIIIEALGKEPVRRHHPHGFFLYQRLENAGVNLIFNAGVEKVEEGSVFYRSDGNVNEIQNIDTLILATGFQSENSLKRPLDKMGIKHVIIGDALEPRMVHEAIHEGAQAPNYIPL